MMLSIKDAIGSSHLTKSSRKIADFILDHKSQVCFMTAADIAAKCHVSDASVIRFSKAIGFRGFKEFQNFFIQEFHESNSVISAEMLLPSDRLEKSMDLLGSTDLFYQHKKVSIDNINSIRLLNQESEFSKACDLILHSHRKFIIGTRSRTGFAEFLALILNQIVDNVLINSSQAMTPFDFIASCNSKDSLVIFSFPRYSSMDLATVKMASDSGTSVILITDKQTAPLVEFSDVTLLVKVDSNAFFNSYTAVQFLCELLCEKVNAKIKTANKEKLNKINKYLSQFKMF